MRRTGPCPGSQRPTETSGEAGRAVSLGQGSVPATVLGCERCSPLGMPPTRLGSLKGRSGGAGRGRKAPASCRACVRVRACVCACVCVWGVGAPTRSPAPKHALSALPPSECPDLKSHATSVSGLKPRGSFSALVLGSSSQSSLQPHKDPQQDPCFRRPWCRGPPRAEPRVLLSRS